MNLPASTAWITVSLIGMPLPGSMPSLNQNTYRNRYASQNTGAETPNRAKSIPARSANEPRLMAETIPMGMPISNHRIAEPIVRASVTGSRDQI